jgi:hypothetical protein
MDAGDEAVGMTTAGAPLRAITLVCLRLGCGRSIVVRVQSSRLAGEEEEEEEEGEVDADEEEEGVGEEDEECPGKRRFCSKECYLACTVRGAAVVPPLGELPEVDGPKLDRYVLDVSGRAVRKIVARSEGFVAVAVTARTSGGLLIRTNGMSSVSSLGGERAPLVLPSGAVDTDALAALLAIGTLQALVRVRDDSSTYYVAERDKPLLGK